MSLPALLQLHLSQPESEGIVEERQSVAGFNSELASEAVFLGHTLAGSEELPSQPVVCKVRVCERKRSWRRLTEHLLGLLWGALAGAQCVLRLPELALLLLAGKAAAACCVGRRINPRAAATLSQISAVGRLQLSAL